MTAEAAVEEILRHLNERRIGAGKKKLTGDKLAALRSNLSQILRYHLDLP